MVFKIASTPEKETTLLAIPEICTDKSLFAGHQGVIKTYLTINEKFFIPNLIQYLDSYIKGCHICQLACNEKPPARQLQTRINLNYTPLSELSIYLQVITRSYKGHKYILCVIDKVINYLIMVPIHQAKSEEIGDALIENVITKYGKPEYIIMDEDSTFMSYLMNYLFKKLDIKIKTVVPYNHQSLQAEHGIKSLSNILTKHLTNLGQMWPKYLPLAIFMYDTLKTQNLGNFSPYKLVFGRKPKLILNLETTCDIKISGTFKDYCELLNKRLQYLHKLLHDFKSKRLAMINKNRTFF